MFRIGRQKFDTLDAAIVAATGTVRNEAGQVYRDGSFIDPPAASVTITVSPHPTAARYKVDGDEFGTLERALAAVIRLGTGSYNIEAYDENDDEIGYYDFDEPEKGWQTS